MAEILNGKELAKNIRMELKSEVDCLRENGIIPKLSVILIGDDPASKIYVRNKSKACDEIGIQYEEILLDSSTTMDKLLEIIDNLNSNKEVNGILLQCPIPSHLDLNRAIETIDPQKDVDGFHPVNVGKLCQNNANFVSCTPLGVIRLLNEYNIETEGKNAVIIGRSNIVGKPMAQCLLNANATVTICHSKTQNIKDITSKADILISAIGKAKFVKYDMVKEGAVVVDVGITRSENGKLCGDIDFDEVSKKASYITPVPGGVGPMTIAMLMGNIVKATKQQN